MDSGFYLRFVLALAFVLGLIGLLAWAVRRLGLTGRLASTGGRERRLEIVEVRPLDAKRRLVLLRRDSVEHLVLTGATGDLLIESGIPAPEPVPSAWPGPAGQPGTDDPAA